MTLRQTLTIVALLATLPTATFGGEKVVVHNNLEYSKPNGQSLKLNLARPAMATSKQLPCVICLHGGGYTAGNRTSFDGFIRKLATKGFVAATVSYRLAPKSKWPAPVHDARAAVRWLRTNAAKYGINPRQIGVMGHSAGAHLAQFLGVTNDVNEFAGGRQKKGKPSGSVQCVVTWAQASDFTREYGIWKTAAASFKKVLGAELSVASRRLHIRASPLFWVTPNAAPSLIIHGTQDKEVLFAQSVWIYERLRSSEVDARLLPIRGGGHSLKDKYRRQAEAATIRFFQEKLNPKTVGRKKS